jgi:hypothetical protein
MRCSLFKFTLALNSPLLFWKLLVVKRRHLYALYLTNIFKNEVRCPSITNPADFHVPTRQIREYSIVSVSNLPKRLLSARCSNVANDICRYLDSF